MSHELRIAPLPEGVATEDALVEQFLQHAESEDTCDHFVGRKKEDHDRIIRLHWLENHGWRDDPPARSASPSPAPERRRSRSPRRSRSSSDMNLFTDLANQTGELMEAATRLHQSVVRLQRFHPIHPVYPRG